MTPIELNLTPGNVSGCTAAVGILSKAELEGSAVMGDKAYSTKEIREYIESHGASYCSPPKANAAKPWECDFFQYKERHAALLLLVLKHTLQKGHSLSL
ncbi:MAG: transposase [Synergistaceae bacterium]|nr:transposase [Synergistaceae bacterium]